MIHQIMNRSRKCGVLILVMVVGMMSLYFAVWLRGIGEKMTFPWMTTIVAKTFTTHSVTTSVQSSKTLTPMSRCAYLTCSHAPFCTTRNTSCCSYVLKETLKFLDAFFQKHAMAYVIVYGTLLGAVRNQTVIPWTHDIDIGLFDKKYLATEKIRDQLDKHGYHMFENLDLTRLCLHSNASDVTLLATHDVHHAPPASIHDVAAYIDLYTVYQKKRQENISNTSIFNIQSSGALLSHISFQKKVTIDGQFFPTVDNIEEHLVKFYGQKYMQEKI